VIATLSFALAYMSINLDNLALVLGLSSLSGVIRVVVAFAITQSVIVGIAALVGDVAEQLPTAWLGWIGVVPLGLGLKHLWDMIRARNGADSAVPPRPVTGMPVMMLTFSGLSLDTFALTAALIADSAEVFDPSVIYGALIAICAVSATGLLASRVASRLEPVVVRLERLAPFVMIASGIYILSNTWTDVA